MADEMSPQAQEILAKVKLPIESHEEYCTVNGRFVHRKSKTSNNTHCGALPKYYTSQPHAHLDATSVAKALKMHVCGKCWPK